MRWMLMGRSPVCRKFSAKACSMPSTKRRWRAAGQIERPNVELKCFSGRYTEREMMRKIVGQGA